MAFGMMCIPLGDASAKHIQNISAYQPGFIAWSRFAIGAVISVSWVLITRQLPTPISKNRTFWFRQSVRGVLIAGVVYCIINAVGLSPMADVFGAFFIGPGISVILAQLFLGIKATRTDWFAVFLGFIGVLMVVQPTGEIGLGIPWALASGCCYGAFLVATRWAAGTAAPMAQMAAQFFVATLCLTPLGIPELITQGLLVPGWVLTAAAFSATANLCSIMALSQVGNAVLAPVVYLQLVSAALVGMFAFNETPNQLATIGLLLIIATGFFQALSRRQA